MGWQTVGTVNKGKAPPTGQTWSQRCKPALTVVRLYPSNKPIRVGGLQSEIRRAALYI